MLTARGPYFFTGYYAPLYWLLLLFNCALPQAFWFRTVRRNVLGVVAICIFVDVGMWLERILIIWNTLSHDYAQSMWRHFHPTLSDWVLLFGPLGLLPSSSSATCAFCRRCRCTKPANFARQGRRLTRKFAAEFEGCRRAW